MIGRTFEKKFHLLFRWMHVYINASVEASVVHRVGFIERKFARASSVIISLDTTRYQLCTFTHKVQFVKRGWRCTCTFAMTWTLFPFSVMSSSCSFSMLWSPGCRYTRLYMSTKIVHFPWNLFFFFFYIASQKRFVFLFFIFLFSMKRYPRF